MFSYEGKKALVTGAGRGIGRAIALAFARQGADVALAARSRDQLEEVAEEIRALGRQAYVLPTNLGDVLAADAMVGQGVEAMGALHVLVNNAGRHARGPSPTRPTRTSAAMVDVNLRAPILLTRRALPHLLASGRGAVINIASLAGKCSIMIGNMP